MSTKIYDGLILQGENNDLYDLIPNVIAPAVQKEFKNLCYELVAEEMAQYMDNKPFLEKQNPGELLFYILEDQWNERQKKMGDHSAFNDPLRFTIVFGKSNHGNILALPYAMGNNYQKALKSTKLFKSYGYWNNSDKPSNITNKAWRQRAEEWDSIEDKNGTYASLPLWQLSGTKTPWSEALIIAASQKSKKLPVNRMRTPKQRLFRLLTAAVAEKLNPIKETKDPFRFIFQARDKVSSYFQENELDEKYFPPKLPENFLIKIEDIPRFEVDTELVDEILSFKTD